MGPALGAHARAAGPGGATTPPLLRGLRAKFIALNMGLAALVLAGSFTAICYMDTAATWTRPTAPSPKP